MALAPPNWPLPNWNRRSEEEPCMKQAISSGTPPASAFEAPDAGCVCGLECGMVRLVYIYIRYLHYSFTIHNSRNTTAMK